MANLRWDDAAPGLSASVSIGMATLGVRGKKETRALLEELLREADAALYYGKNHGRNQSHVFQELP